MLLDRTNRWRPAGALVCAVFVVLGCLVVAVLLRRPDLVVIAAPFVVGIGLALTRRPGDPQRDVVTLRLPGRPVWENDVVLAEVRLAADGDVDLACVGVQHGTGVDIEAPGALQVVPMFPGAVTTVHIPIRAQHWGREAVGPVEVSYAAAHGAFFRDRPPGRTSSLSIVPLRAVFDATDHVPDPAGLVGTHRSRRMGSGTELLSIRPFQPGDRLKRITWPVSLRTGQLHVTTSTDDRDTDVMLVLDPSIEVGDPRTGTSLDIGVRATASVAEHYLRQGDRVGVLDLGRARRPVRPDAGRRHMYRVLDLLLGAESDSSMLLASHDDGRVTHVLRDVPPRALVMVFSPLLDDQGAHRIGALARSGHTVLVVDTLPPGVQAPTNSEWTPLAWRMAMLGRDNLLLRLEEVGVPVVAWQGAGSLDQVLRVLSRAAVAPRRRR